MPKLLLIIKHNKETMQQEETTLEDIAKSLNNSLMYNLSLTSKELFHSNFLAWLGRNESTKPFFVKVIKHLTSDSHNGINGIDLSQYNEDWTVEREDKNFDLCIKRGEDYILVIENKVKAIPREDQLDEYVKKIKLQNNTNNNTRFLLLTLYLKFRGYGPWMIKRYKDLAEAMELNLENNIPNGSYEKEVIEDYIRFIRNMNELAKKWREQIEKQEVFAVPFTDVNVTPGLKKLSDLYTKIQFSIYCEKMKKKLKDELINQDFLHIEIFNSESKAIKEMTIDDKKLYIDVHYSYASSSHQGILDVAIPVDNLENPKIKYGTVKPDYFITIQIEGKQYRHVLESNNDKVINNKLYEIGISDFYTTPGHNSLHFFSNNPKNDPEAPSYGNKDIFEDKLYPVEDKKIKENRPFNTYRNSKKQVTFIYQSRKINKNATVDKVLGNIVDDIRRIITSLKIP